MINWLLKKCVGSDCCLGVKLPTEPQELKEKNTDSFMSKLTEDCTFGTLLNSLMGKVAVIQMTAYL